MIARLTAWALSKKPVRAFLHYSEHRGPQLADSITYRALFSVFAAVLLGFTVAAAWLAGNDEARAALIQGVDAAIPGLIGDGGVIDPAQLQAPAALTLAGVISLVGLVGAAIGAISSTRSALRVLADRGADDVFWLWVLLRNLGLAVAIAVGLAISSAATFFGTELIGLVSGWAGSALAGVAVTVLSIVVVFALDAALIALLFVALSGMKAPARTIIPGALIGAVGLIVLQELSTLFVRGAGSNPLLASFASLIALLLWFNLSAQVMLIACSYIVVGVQEIDDRVRAKYGASTFAQRRVQNAEDAVALATAELERARSALTDR
ncbi:YihY/virulence factor BrkB family protein [Microbacterium terrisoli]|uniref:YihY/virulence factor BrkB family protein n=1 Tax=Microbacterium terrisoli TaxID=3242192 RepID=UPI002803B449|nr:YihY/virulence factor BrkB family protein [Microbacterium protaetiae]